MKDFYPQERSHGFPRIRKNVRDVSRVDANIRNAPKLRESSQMRIEREWMMKKWEKKWGKNGRSSLKCEQVEHSITKYNNK